MVKKVMTLRKVRKLIQILEDKAYLDMHREVRVGGTGFTSKYERFLDEFDARKYVKENAFVLV